MRAEPLLFREIRIQRRARLRLLATRVLEFHKHPNCKTWIRRLDLDDFGYQMENMSSLKAMLHLDLVHIIVMNTCSLEIYRDQNPVMCSTLSLLANVAKNNLRDLVIKLDPRDQLLPLQLLNHFWQLERLSLLFCEVDNPIAPNFLHGLSHLCLPNVTYFKFSWPDSEWLPTVVGEALAQCRLEGVIDICLLIPFMENENIPHVFQLLTGRNHEMGHAELELDEDVLDELRDTLLQTFAELKFRSCSPSSTFLDVWERGLRCQKLYLQFCLDDDDLLWPVIDSLAKNAGDRFLGSSFILSVGFEECVDEPAFEWTYPPSSNAYAAFVGRLMHHSRILEGKGITIVDCKGRTGFDRIR